MKFLFTLIILFSGFFVFCQTENENSENGVVYHLKDGSILKGTLVSDSPFSSRLLIYTGDTISVPQEAVLNRYKKAKGRIDIGGGKHFYKNGFHLDIASTIGFGNNAGHTKIEISINKRLTEKLSVGIGIGNQYDETSFELIGNSRRVFLEHRTTPVFAQGKYFLNLKKKRFYVNSKMGYAIGRSNWWSRNEAYNGFTFQYGIGFNKATKRGVRTFIQLSQTHSYSVGQSSGRFNWWDVNPEIQDFDYKLWINRITFTYGVEINLRKRRIKF